MSNTDTAAPAALRNPLDGLKRPQIKQLGQVIQRTAAFTADAEKARKAISEHRFTVRSNYSKAETQKAILQAGRAEKAREKAEAGLAKLAETLKANKPVKAALAAYLVIQKDAGAGNTAARRMLDEVNADLTIAMASRSPAAKEKAVAAPTSKEAAVEELLNGIAAGRGAKKIEERIGELTERARGEMSDEAAGQRKRREPNEYQEPAMYPASLLARYTLRGKEVVDKRLGDVAFVDHGKELRAGRNDVSKDVIDAMLDTAASRGWAPLKVFGTQAFKAAVWMEAASRGLDVTGYKPSVQEQAAAAQNRAINGHDNRIMGERGKAEATPPTRNQQLAAAFQEAGTSKAQAKAAKEYPELAKAFALMAAFDKALARPGMSKNEVRDFTDQFKDLVASRLENGKQLPNIELRDHQQEKQQAQAEDQER